MHYVTKLLLTGLMLLFLNGCATSQGNAESTGSDLEILVMAVEAMLPERSPAGDVKHAEDATTTGTAWNLLLDLEEVDFLHEQDKIQTKDFVRKAAARIAESRRVCNKWDRLWNLRECR